MPDPIISVENLGKRYRLGATRSNERYTALRDVISDKARSLFRRSASNPRTPASDDFWALKDVSFEVKKGEVLGIIGRNGAGKSTLLKILSRITEPTDGRIRLRGRVASLLEVGTGFHPELTGRENIYLNGAILGMHRAEIKKKFDEIVAFAETEKFLDTPVKRYSSGMYVRLAFAVAAHLEPEILIVDEVLAVGDAEFQKKCLGKMREVAQGQGRTVLFVSHNLEAISSLCSVVIRLSGGELAGQGAPDTEVSAYINDRVKASGAKVTTISPSEGFTLERIELVPEVVQTGSRVRFEVRLTASSEVRLHEAALLIDSLLGVRVGVFDLRQSAGPRLVLPSEPLTISGWFEVPLIEGVYSLGLYLSTSAWGGEVLQVNRLEVIGRPDRGELLPYQAKYRGFVEIVGEIER